MQMGHLNHKMAFVADSHFDYNLLNPQFAKSTLEKPRSKSPH